jgi:Uncharacterised protein family (UPF0236)
VNNIPAKAEIPEGTIMQSSVQQQLECLSPLLTGIVQEFEGLVKQLWLFALGNPDVEFSHLEEQARQLHRECFSSAVQGAAQVHRSRIEERWLLGKIRCECGQTPQYKGKQRRTLQTWVGAVTLERGYFYCKGCGTGHYPLDEALGIAGREHFSDGVQQGVCLLGVQMPFERASHTMEALTGICVSPREAERMTEQRGLALEESLQAEGQELLLLTDEISSHSSPVGVWAVTLDAGKVRYEDGWHDAKAGVVFWAEPAYNQAGEIEGARATKQSYVAEVGSMEEAGERLSAEACRRGIGPEEEVVCLGDGAPSNWTQFDEHFANRIEVLDWYHAVEHLWQVGNGIFGQGTPEAVKWVKQWEGELWEGRIEAVIVALHRESRREGAEGEAAREQIHYFETNKERMRYSQYRAAGYPIGSGTVESACKRLIGARMKGAGMCWGKRGAQGVLTLRAELLSKRWDQSWPKTRPLRKAA